jgi:hypothetical protein
MSELTKPLPEGAYDSQEHMYAMMECKDFISSLTFKEVDLMPWNWLLEQLPDIVGWGELPLPFDPIICGGNPDCIKYYSRCYYNVAWRRNLGDAMAKLALLHLVRPPSAQTMWDKEYWNNDADREALLGYWGHLLGQFDDDSLRRPGYRGMWDTDYSREDRTDEDSRVRGRDPMDDPYIMRQARLFESWHDTDPQAIRPFWITPNHDVVSLIVDGSPLPGLRNPSSHWRSIPSADWTGLQPGFNVLTHPNLTRRAFSDVSGREARLWVAKNLVEWWNGLEEFQPGLGDQNWSLEEDKDYQKILSDVVRRYFEKNRNAKPYYKRGRFKDITDIELIIGNSEKPKARYGSARCRNLRKDDCALYSDCHWVIGKGCKPGPPPKKKPPKKQKKSKTKKKKSKKKVRCSGVRKADCEKKKGCHWVVGRGGGCKKD